MAKAVACTEIAARRAFALVLCCLFLLLGAAPALAQAGGYEATTREAIQKLLAANQLIASGQATQSRALVQQLAEPIRALDGLAEKYREVANREHARCTTRIADLDVRTNELFEEQGKLNDKINGLTADLAGAGTTRDLAAAEVNRLNQALAQAVQSLRDREAKLEELRKWWWVPGYGQYLAIRTLVDGDIGEYNRTVTELRDQQARLRANAATLNDAQALIASLNLQKQQATNLNRQLTTMRESAQANLKGLNGISVFLTDADVFWGLVQNLLQVDGEAYVRKMQIIQAVIARDSQNPAFDNPSLVRALSFQQKITEFAATIDKQSNFLLDATTDFCGGPPPPPLTSLAVSARCNIDQFTAYYEIVDPKTCSFRYLSPPGCPPAAKMVSEDAGALARGQARGQWTRANGQNWIGKPSTSPCLIAGRTYYGKVATSDQCDARCKADPNCRMWSHNVGNGFIPDSTGQCWGAAISTDANRRDWGGFNSGGLGDAAPPGSYAQSCSGVQWVGSGLSASCRAINGAMVQTSLADVDLCRGDIGNNNGVLQCPRS